MWRGEACGGERVWYVRRGQMCACVLVCGVCVCVCVCVEGEVCTCGVGHANRALQNIGTRPKQIRPNWHVNLIVLRRKSITSQSRPHHNVLLTCRLFSSHKHVIPGGMKHEAVGRGYLIDGTVRPLCRGLGVVKEFHRTVLATRRKHRDIRVEIQSNNCLCR